jgi:hypothetical protein
LIGIRSFDLVLKILWVSNYKKETVESYKDSPKSECNRGSFSFFHVVGGSNLRVLRATVFLWLDKKAKPEPFERKRFGLTCRFLPWAAVFVL